MRSYFCAVDLSLVDNFPGYAVVPENDVVTCHHGFVVTVVVVNHRDATAGRQLSWIEFRGACERDARPAVVAFNLCFIQTCLGYW